jgi:hypothetical protein
VLELLYTSSTPTQRAGVSGPHARCYPVRHTPAGVAVAEGATSDRARNVDVRLRRAALLPRPWSPLAGFLAAHMMAAAKSIAEFESSPDSTRGRFNPEINHRPQACGLRRYGLHYGEPCRCCGGSGMARLRPRVRQGKAHPGGTLPFSRSKFLSTHGLCVPMGYGGTLQEGF